MSEDRTKYMTVGALIAKLSEYPPDATVLLEDPDTAWDAPVYVRRDDDGTVMLWSEYSEMDGDVGKGHLRRKP
jgi:hypothetical protein